MRDVPGFDTLLSLPKLQKFVGVGCPELVSVLTQHIPAIEGRRTARYDNDAQGLWGCCLLSGVAANLEQKEPSCAISLMI